MTAYEQFKLVEAVLAAEPLDVARLAVALRTAAEESSALQMMIGVCARGIERMLTLDVLRRWPQDGLETLISTLAAMPYRPDAATYPCGRRELFVAEVLRDRSLPKPVRVRFWKYWAMGECVFPNYLSDVAWNLPSELMDHPSARAWYCAQGRPGASVIQCSDPLFFGLAPEPELEDKVKARAFEAIAEDAPGKLMMPLAVAGEELPRAFFVAALKAMASKIICALFSRYERTLKWMSIEQLLFYVCANWDSDRAIPVVSLVERISPGFAGAAHDALGRTPLWYTLYQRDELGRPTGTAGPARVPLIEELVRLGCDPSEENDLGLSYNDVAGVRWGKGGEWRC